VEGDTLCALVDPMLGEEVAIDLYAITRAGS